jgi:hypothetical protein
MHIVVVPRIARRYVASLVAAAALVCSAAPAAQAATSAPVSHQVSQSPAQVRAYWTPQRLQSAAPVDSPEVAGPSYSIASLASAVSQASGQAVEIHPTSGRSTYASEPGSETSFPQRVHGKVFFTVPTQGDFACSGTLVASLLRNVVVTAGHCVDDPDVQQWSVNLIFIPAYRDGVAPLGAYPATSLLSTDEWTTSGDLSYDVGIAQLATPLEDQLGARGIVFNKPPKSTYQIFGYPGLPNPPYNGERLVACDASFFSLQYTGHPFSTIAYPCDMQEGSSGGGWVTPAGVVASVVSHGSCEFDPSTCGQIAGPYFGDAIKALYNKAGGSAECPPARLVAKQDGKQFKKARKLARHHSSRKAAKRLKKASRKLNKAKNKRDGVC